MDEGSEELSLPRADIAFMVVSGAQGIISAERSQSVSFGSGWFRRRVKSAIRKLKPYGPSIHPS